MANLANPLTVGLQFMGDEPFVLVRMSHEWRTLPYANACLFARQIIEIIEAIKPRDAQEKLTDCPELGPYVEIA